jgi:hypothetical protein
LGDHLLQTTDLIPQHEKPEIPNESVVYAERGRPKAAPKDQAASPAGASASSTLRLANDDLGAGGVREARVMSVVGATPENICSFRVFRILTLNGHLDAMSVGPRVQNDCDAPVHP